MNRTVYDTVNETKGDRLSVHKEKDGVTTIPYSNGAEVTWEKTADGDGTRLKEVRTLTKVKTAHSLWTRTQYRDDQYDRIFRKGIYAKKEEDTNG